MKATGTRKRVMIILGVTILVLGALEVATRAFVSSDAMVNMNFGGFKIYHPTRGTQLKPNYVATDISINSHGILGPEFEMERSPRAIRILTIGDSVTFWPSSRNYPRVMEERLRGFFPDAGIEVVVGAVGGYSSNDALDWYDDFLHKLNPDVAIVHLGWNDMGQFHPFGLRYKNENLAYQGRTVLGTMMENLYFLRIPYVAIGRWERSRPVDTSPLTTEESRVLDEFAPRHFETNLETLVRKLKDRGSVVYLVVCAGLITYPPTPDELRRMHFPRGMKKKLAIYKSVYVKYTESLERVAGITRTPLIDLRELIRGAEERRIFTDTVHIDTEGAERFGNYMADAIRPGVREIRARKAGSLGSLAH